MVVAEVVGLGSMLNAPRPVGCRPGDVSLVRFALTHRLPDQFHGRGLVENPPSYTGLHRHSAASGEPPAFFPRLPRRSPEVPSMYVVTP
jgi:hypothetical protein